MKDNELLSSFAFLFNLRCYALEPQIAAAAAAAVAAGTVAGGGGAAAPALPAGARQILPVIEAYFALAAAVHDAASPVKPPW